MMRSNRVSANISSTSVQALGRVLLAMPTLSQSQVRPDHAVSGDAARGVCDMPVQTRLKRIDEFEIRGRRSRIKLWGLT